MSEPHITMKGAHFYKGAPKVTVQDGSVTIDFTGLAVMPIADYELARIALDARRQDRTGGQAVCALERTASLAVGSWIGAILWWIVVGYSDFAAGMAAGGTWAALFVWRDQIAKEPAP